MKKGIFYSPLLLLLAAAGILQECCAAAGYEFLTPKAVVLKSDKAPKGNGRREGGRQSSG